MIVTSALTIAEVLWMRGAPKVTEEKAKVVNWTCPGLVDGHGFGRAGGSLLRS